jgi:hypothetical protein
MFEVIEQEVGISRNCKEGIPRRETTGIDCGVKTSPAAFAKTVVQKPRLGERLTPRKGHTATGGIEEDPVSLELIDELVDRPVATGELASIGRAGFDARSTSGAGTAIPELPRRNRSTLLHRTGLGTGAATQAAIGADHQNRGIVDTLRVVTPTARKRTSLEKDCGPNARAIVHRTPLEVEDPPGPSSWLYGNCVRRHISQLIS